MEPDGELRSSPDDQVRVDLTLRRADTVHLDPHPYVATSPDDNEWSDGPVVVVVPLVWLGVLVPLVWVTWRCRR